FDLFTSSLPSFKTKHLTARDSNENTITSHSTMKLFTYSEAITLFSILAPVTAMAIHQGPELIAAPNRNSDFSFYCRSGKSYNKNYLMGEVRDAINLIGESRTFLIHPEPFEEVQYQISGEQWFYPLQAYYGSRDHVVFTRDAQVAGVVHLMIRDNGERYYDPCIIT
ncbi:BgTH12-06064, partial [Blumeria graminis f. sp. triticale]